MHPRLHASSAQASANLRPSAQLRSGLLLSPPLAMLHAAFYGELFFPNESCSNPAEEGRKASAIVPVLWMERLR